MGKTIEISDSTWDKIKGLVGEEEVVEVNNYKDLIGKKWFFRTVTYHLLGEAVKIVGDFVLLKNASWIASSGRFMQFIKEGKTDEVEPVGEVYVNIKTVIDFYNWTHKLPTTQK